MSEGGKRSAQQSSGPVSPKKYILTRARSLPISACYINRNWKDSHMAEMIIVRKHKNANVTAGFYLVDLLAHGVKDTHFVFNEPEPVFNENVKGTFPEGYLEKTSYALAHNIIYGAVEFAADHGYKAHKDFSLTRHILEDDTDEIELIDIEFGIKGQPSFLRKAGPDDQAPFDETGQDDLPVFYSYSDEDWKEFLMRNEKLKKKEIPEIFNAIYQHIYDKTYAEQGLPTDLPGLNDYNINFQPDRRYCKSHEEIKVAEKMARKVIKAGPGNSRRLEQEVYKLIALYPENPLFYNYLANLLRLQDREKQYGKTLYNMHRLFPRYLTGKLMLANQFIDENKPGKVIDLFPGLPDLRKIFPERETFHFTEFCSFHATMMRYFTLTRNVLMAQYFFNMLIETEETIGIPEGVFKMDVVKTAEREFELFKIDLCIEFMESLAGRNFIMKET